MDELSIKEEVDKKLQVALTLSIFLPSLLSVFYDAGGVPRELLNKINLSWSLLVGFFLLDYILFSLTKRSKLSAWIYTAIDITLLIAIGFFIVPIVLMATTVPNKPTTFFNTLAANISMHGLPVAPIVITIFFIAGIVGDFVKDLGKKHWKRGI